MTDPPAHTDDDPAASPTDDLNRMGRSEAAKVKRFLAEHGGPGTAVVHHLGRSGARLVVVAADGRWTDSVRPSVAAATAVANDAHVPIGQWSRELSASMRTSSAERRRMAGSGR